MRKATKKVLSVMLAVSLAVPNGLFAGKVYAETNSNLASSNVQADKRRDLSELTAMGITYDKEYSYTTQTSHIKMCLCTLKIQ